MNGRIKNQIYFNLFLFLFLFSISFGQDKVAKEFSVVDGKKAVITEKPEQFSIQLNSIKSGLAELDTFEIVDRNENYYKVAFISKENDYKLGWIRQSDSKEVFTVEDVYQLKSAGEDAPVSEMFRDYKPHLDWGALKNGIIRNGGLLSGMNKSMVTASVGKPDGVNKYYTSNMNIEQWTYRKPPHGDYILTFEGDNFSSISQSTEPLSVKFEKKLAKRPKYPYRDKGIELMAFGGATALLTYAFLRDEDSGNSILFSEKHRTFSWVVTSAFIASESAGLYLFLYKNKQDEVGATAGGDRFNLKYTHRF